MLLQVDANATIGMLHRQGLGKVRHISTQELWLQQAVKQGKVAVEKVEGTENTADLGTKPRRAIGLDHLMRELRFMPIN